MVWKYSLILFIAKYKYSHGGGMLYIDSVGWFCTHRVILVAIHRCLGAGVE